MADNRRTFPRTRSASLGYPPEGIPTFILGDKWILEGAVPTQMLKDVALEVAAAS